MTDECPFRESERLKWHRPPIDRAVLAELTKRSDLKGFRQVLGHLGLGLLTGTLAFLAWKQINSENWMWSVPLLLLAMFAHGTICSFFGGVACHELMHGTVFRTKRLNSFFVRIFAFLGWWDHVWFRISHFKHHQVTTHHEFDGEVVLPQTLSFKDWQLWLGITAWNPRGTYNLIKTYAQRAMGKMDNQWYEYVMPEEDEAMRREHRNWARIHLSLHAALALTFILTGNWILIFLVNLASQYCTWLAFLCGTPQHYGMQPEVTDHRLCCRTYITRGLPAFLYWNMQYHIEHHMYPAVPFHSLPKLRKTIDHDLPPAPIGLGATWKEIIGIVREQADDPNYYFVPALPDQAETETATVEDLARELNLA
jgi:fatty acid desaturase